MMHRSPPVAWLWLTLVACGGGKDAGSPAGPNDTPSPTAPTTDTGSTPDTSSDTASDTGTPPGSLRVDVVSEADPHIVVIEAVPGIDTEVAIACDAGADEVLLFELASLTGRADLVGLLADTSYDCTLVDLATDERASFSVHTAAGSAPTATVTTHPTLQTTAPPFLLVNTNDQCGSDPTPSLRLYDLDGRSRWAHEQASSVNLAVEARYHGDGLVVWGGGYSPDHALQYLQLDQTVLDTQGLEVAPDATMFHHDGKLLDDGTELILAEVPNTDGATTWLGWRAIAQGGGWSGEVDSQQLFDAGWLPAGGEGEDAYHANWIDLVDGVLYVSQCFTDEILAIDPDTADLLWRIGPGPDSLQLVDDAGAPLPADAWPMCQHGLEVVGDQLLIYDNGRYPDRQYSRAMALTVDPVGGTATVDWVYTEPDWFDNAMGDIDDLGDGRALIHMAHVECWGLFEDHTTTVEFDTASQEVVWRMAFDDPYVASYRAERTDACDVIGHAGYCPGVAERLDDLGL